MRYLVPSSAGGRRSVVPRVARSLASAAAALALAACSWITGVPDVDRVTVTVTPATIFAGGQPGQVIGQSLRKDGSVITHNRRIVSFRSSNPAVATVSGSGTGIVSGVAAGTAYIIAENDGKRDSALVTVLPPQAPDIPVSYTHLRAHET